MSSIRLERYRTPGGPNLNMLANYFWNMDLAEALFPTLHAVGVGLHNTIHSTLNRPLQHAAVVAPTLCLRAQPARHGYQD
jgi:hypothetical protein